MLDYELCEKLREAGFPQKLNNGDWAYMKDTDELHLLKNDADTNWFIGNDYSSIVSENEWIKCPALSELINACIEKGRQTEHRLFVLEFVPILNKWSSHLGQHPFEYMAPKSYGETPEIAVANLYLALHANSVNS